MTKRKIILLTCMLSFVTSSKQVRAGAPAFIQKIYKTDAFSIEYPKSFKAKGSKHEAYFSSTDGSVIFYVYAIDTASIKSHYAKVSPLEIEISNEVEKGGDDDKEYNYNIYEMATVEAKDGSYLRSYFAQIECNFRGTNTYDNCVSHVFGIKYKDMTTYDRYKDEYTRFKKSLEYGPFDTRPYDFEKDRDRIVFVCQKEICSYDDKESGVNNIPLIKDWAIEQPIFYETAGAVKANVPSITYINTKNGLLIGQDIRQMTIYGSRQAVCIDAEDTICLFADSVKGKNREEGYRLMKKIKKWRDGYYK